MAHYDLNIHLEGTNRADIRTEVFVHWIAELPGTLDERNTYRYNAELLSNGAWIYLSRPAPLNKGADFVINCEHFLLWQNGNDRPPRHQDLFDEVTPLVGMSDNHRVELLTALRRIWDCETPATVLADLNLLQGNVSAQRKTP